VLAVRLVLVQALMAQVLMAAQVHARPVALERIAAVADKR
jgi:hypothetical protein